MILVTGARGVVGAPLCGKLAESGQAYLAVSRRSGGEHTVAWDMSQPAGSHTIDLLQGIHTVFHCAPIWLLPAHLQLLREAGMSRLIAFSSTSVLSKSESGSAAERQLVKRLADAEYSLQQYCNSSSVALTIFRPSMVYGRTLDRNIMQIARSIRRFGIAIVAGEASGKRQPVYCDDLVSALLLAHRNSHTYGKTYELAGSEIISYRLLIERIFEALGKKPHVVSLPLGLVRSGLRIAALFSNFGYTADMADRMNQDLVYDCSQASKDFAYTSRGFSLDPRLDLGVPS